MNKTNTKLSFIASAFVLGISSLFATVAKAQTSSPGVNSILGETNDVIQQVTPGIQQLEREGQRYQNYLNQLFNQCMAGNRAACNEHDRRMKAQNRHLDRIIEQQRQR